MRALVVPSPAAELWPAGTGSAARPWGDCRRYWATCRGVWLGVWVVRSELRLQKCNACGELRHPPGPVCPVCHAMDRGYVVASGRGTIFSFLVHHAPQMPGRELPVTIALVELEESREARSPLRFVADVRGNPEDLAIGDAVVVGWDRVDDELTLPVWELAR